VYLLGCAINQSVNEAKQLVVAIQGSAVQDEPHD
jgi:hypothetical protein